MDGNKCSMVPLALALACFVALSGAQSSPPPVQVAQGLVQGTTETFAESEFIGVEKTIDVYRGIPFAEPPVGPLRFRAPVAKEPWAADAVYNATYYRDACVQDPAGLFSAPSSEDCLQLNIYAPRPAMLGGAAVMVWIHGGGFTGGSAVVPVYYGQPLVAVGDVIMVSIQYRLNVFGYLTTGDEALPGNLGMLDQVAALKWIKENIAAFGGDPNKITIFGESAGSASVNFHLVSEMSKGLFANAIMQSGTVFSPWATFDDMEVLRKQAFGIGEKVGCTQSDSSALVDCLREKDATELYLNSGLAEFRSPVVVDGKFLTAKADMLYATGRFNNVKLLHGSNRDEGTLSILSNPRFADYFVSPTAPHISKEVFDQMVVFDFSVLAGQGEEDIAHLMEAIKMLYIDWSVAEYNNTDYFRNYVDFATDMSFACGHDRVGRLHAQAGDDVFSYQMTYAPALSVFAAYFGSPGWIGAGHAEELLLVFGVPFIPELQEIYAAIPPEEKRFSVKFMEFWTNFAKTGNPGTKTPGSQPESSQDYWPRFTVPELDYKVLDLNLTTSRALKSRQCYFWNKYVPQLETMLGNLEETQRDWRESYAAWKYTDIANWREEFARYRETTKN